jgi:SAM-dependent methyltransferase
MIDLDLVNLKLLNAQLVECTIGEKYTTDDNKIGWSPKLAYLQGVASEEAWSLTHITEKKAIDWIARRLPKNSLVVEVGSFVGASAAIWANANSEIHVKAVDLYDQEKWAGIANSDPAQYESTVDAFLPIAKLAQEFLQGPITVENVRSKYTHYKNLEFLQGASPDEFVQSAINDIDVYFEDSNHSNPGLAKNIEFWCSRVKPGGLVMLHDYSPYLPMEFSDMTTTVRSGAHKFPDVEHEVNKLIAQGYTIKGTVRSLVILQKPTAV